MNNVFYRWFILNWPRKLVAIISSLIIYVLVSETLTTSETLYNVPVRVINIPSKMTVEGLMANGLLNKTISVSLEGKKSVIANTQSNDIEVVINAQGKKESWIATVDKKSLVSLSPDLDVKRDVTSVSANDLFIVLSDLITLEIPIIITKPIGSPPQGYQFLDIWPHNLTQTVSGPEREVEALQERGLTLTFDLSKIKKSELKTLTDTTTHEHIDEVSFFIPGAWKKVSIPFRGKSAESLNDPRAEFLRIDFLKQDLLPLHTRLPISIFFPPQYSETLNPTTHALADDAMVVKENGLTFFALPLYARNVSRLFLDVVRDNLELIIIAAPKEKSSNLDWTLAFVNEKALEDSYVKKVIDEQGEIFGSELQPSLREDYLRSRFYDYIRSMELYISDGKKLRLQAELKKQTIQVSTD